MDTRQRTFGRGLAMLASALLAAAPAHAGQTGAAQYAPPPPAGPAVQSQGHMPDVEQVYVLIRSAILTLDTAMRAGNFSVLRDVGSPSFQAANTSARLARIFQNLDQQGIDLSSVAITAPTITALQMLEQGRVLRVTGYFPSPRSRIDFDLMFENVGGRWRIFGLSVNPAPVVTRGPSAVRAQPTPSNPCFRRAGRWCPTAGGDGPAVYGVGASCGDASISPAGLPPAQRSSAHVKWRPLRGVLALCPPRMCSSMAAHGAN